MFLLLTRQKLFGFENSPVVAINYKHFSGLFKIGLLKKKKTNPVEQFCQKDKVVER